MTSSYFFNEKGIVRKELVDEKAEAIARSLISSEKNWDGKAKNGVTSSQLRKFFNQIKSLERKIVLDSSADWDHIEPELLLIKAKCAYIVARQKSKYDVQYYKELEKFLKESIDHVKSLDDFKVFVKMFEAVVGYFYGLGGKDA